MKVKVLVSGAVEFCRSDSRLLTYSLNCIGVAQCSFKADDGDRYATITKHHNQFAAYIDHSSGMVTKSIFSLKVVIVSCALQNSSLDLCYFVADAGWWVLAFSTRITRVMKRLLTTMITLCRTTSISLLNDHIMTAIDIFEGTFHQQMTLVKPTSKISRPAGNTQSSPLPPYPRL
jgi:hypothetical protein